MFCTKYEIFDCFVSNWRRIYHCMIHTICNKLFIFILILVLFVFGSVIVILMVFEEVLYDFG